MQLETRTRWVYSMIDDKSIDSFARQLNIDPLLAKILMIHNIGQGQVQKIQEFISPSIDLITDIHNLSTDENMNNALMRIQKALALNEKILVQGDADADGITATTVMVAGLCALGLDVSYDFPIRPKEGHGLQPRIIDKAKINDIAVIITTDCGSKDIVATNYANQQGIDVIITDHHRAGNELPPAIAIINPFLVQEETLAQGLAGAGVAFKLVLSIYERLGETMPQDLFDYLLAITALGTISDRMSLLNVANRVIVNKGIEALNDTDMEGLKALKLISSNYNDTVCPREISRTITPRLNAPGRIGDPEEGIPDSNIVVDLLLLGTGKKNAKRASKLIQTFSDVVEMEQELKHNSRGFQDASIVEDINEKRKYITTKIEDEIEGLIKQQVNDQDLLIIVQGKNWNPGVIGIDTDRLRDRFLRPAMIMTAFENNPYIKGSIRSIPTINMYKVIENVSNKFETQFNKSLFKVEVQTANGVRVVNAFGGHAQACGFTLHKEDVPAFIKLAREEVGLLAPNSFNYSYSIVSMLNHDDLNMSLIKKLDLLAPFGQTFEYPIFYLKNCEISKVRAFGNKYQENRTPHIEFNVLKSSKISNPLRAVGFSLYEKYLALVNNNIGSKYHIIFTIERQPSSKRRRKSKNSFRLNVLDIKISE
jgi:single-stranded-DNA-specific exonuclease